MYFNNCLQVQSALEEARKSIQERIEESRPETPSQPLLVVNGEETVTKATTKLIARSASSSSKKAAKRRTEKTKTEESKPAFVGYFVPLLSKAEMLQLIEKGRKEHQQQLKHNESSEDELR